MEPQNLKTTWTNILSGENRIEKRLDRFLLGGILIGKDMQFKQWVHSGDESNHLPICLDLMRNPQKPISPFKFCAAWIKHEEVLRLIHSNWIPYGVESTSHAATHYEQNLARIKKLLKEW